jgi:hypothetical protein
MELVLLLSAVRRPSAGKTLRNDANFFGQSAVDDHPPKIVAADARAVDELNEESIQLAKATVRAARGG